MASNISDAANLQTEVGHLRNIFKKNGYSYQADLQSIPPSEKTQCDSNPMQKPEHNLYTISTKSFQLHQRHAGKSQH
jgi:hypothetical protein